MSNNPIVLLNARMFVAGADLSGAGSKIEIKETAEVRKRTNWRSGGAEENVASLFATDWSAEGFYEAGDPSKPDDLFWATRRTLDPWSAAPFSDSDLAAGSLMYLNKVLRADSTFGGDVGDVDQWSMSGRSTWPLCRGKCGHPSGVPRAATGNGTAVQLGAISSTRYLYANLHVLSASGTTPSMTVKIQSDDNAGFTTPTDVTGGSFAAATTTGQSGALRVAGPLTDTYFRVVYTISGTTPSFLFLVAMGIE
jgi:hypothetical protein